MNMNEKCESCRVELTEETYGTDCEGVPLCPTCLSELMVEHLEGELKKHKAMCERLVEKFNEVVIPFEETHEMCEAIAGRSLRSVVDIKGSKELLAEARSLLSKEGKV